MWGPMGHARHQGRHPVIAALILFAAAVAIFAPGIVRILRDDPIARLTSEALDGPDYAAGIAAFDSLGRSENR